MYTKMHMLLRRRCRSWRLLGILVLFVIGYFGALIPTVIMNKSPNMVFPSDAHYMFRHLLGDNSTDGGFDYPPEAFTEEQLKSGAVVLHVIGLIYMFIALAIVCDEFFVPSLSVIIEKFDITEDVAGATFMAAGGSAPELFTSLIGVFFARNNVGIGTIVGSATFNILFVIGMCAIFSKGVLDLTWWPLFRDVTFYSIDLIVLIVFFRDEIIVWWEALVLFLLYIIYVVFMKYNEKIETFVKTKIVRRKTRIHSNDSLLTEEIQAKRKPHRSCSIPIIHSGTSHFRHGVLQLMIHTIDPISESHVQDKAIKLHTVANPTNNATVVEMPAIDENPTNNQNGNNADKNSNKPKMLVHTISNGHMPVSPTRSTGSPLQEDGTLQQTSSTRNSNNTETSLVESPNSATTPHSEHRHEIPGADEDAEEPLDMSWPSTWQKRITYVILFPLTFVLWIMLPDTRRPEKKKYFFVTFFGSIFWIFIFSYLMVWWANTTGETIGIPNEVMGLTILAAGTSIPDLITSVIVAKKGLGDMAVSSSVGSNIFDITVGLPVPWLLYNMVYVGKPISVDSNGLACSILLLFGMLITVVIVIAASKWKMTHFLGGCMLALYLVFVVLSVLLELKVIGCPVD